MKRLFTARNLALAAFAFASPLAWGHAGHDVGGAAAGFAHPFAGLDHLLAMLAIGLWAAQQGGKARWAVPLAFVATMALGALAGFAGIGLPAVEPMVAASVVVLGLILASGVRAPLTAGVTIAASFALFHGYAHGAEAAAAPIAAYMAGMLAATAMLHFAGFATGLAVRATALRWAGALVAAGGAALMLTGA
jgi:urease accessory protein